MNRLFTMLALIVGLTPVFLTSCDDDDSTKIEPPVAEFSVEIDVNASIVTFTSLSIDAETYSWDFGDEVGTSSDENPTYTYSASGTYAVTLKVTNEGGEDELTKNVVVSVNEISNGTFDDDSNWTIISNNSSGVGSVVIADGVATIDDGVELGTWESNAHWSFYQAVTLEAGDYQLDMDITTNEIFEIWVEIWIGTEVPVEGSDYGDPATKVLSFNTWDCADTNSTYSGPMAEESCQDTDGSITLEAGTYYIVTRAGGNDFGDGGIVFDNFKMVKQ